MLSSFVKECNAVVACFRNLRRSRRCGSVGTQRFAPEVTGVLGVSARQRRLEACACALSSAVSRLRVLPSALSAWSVLRVRQGPVRSF